MDSNECKSLISSARSSWGKIPAEILNSFNLAADDFNLAALSKFGKKGEW
jgi:hypothetical protein